MSSGGQNVLPFVPRNWRHEKATAEGLRRDQVYFRTHPDRMFRVRKELPWEFETISESELKIVLVRFDPLDGQLNKIALTTKAPLPDHDRFLGSLWFYIEIMQVPGQELSIAPLDHLRLLEETGAA
jgi:hypothetical protein